MLKASAKKSKGQSIDPNLKNALNNQAIQTGKVQHIPLSNVIPNPDNKRNLVIPLDEFLSTLKVGEENSVVYVDGDALFFPERDQLHGLGIELDIRTNKEERFYDKIRELALSIYRHDRELIQPVECSPEGDDFLLGSGHRRWFASHFVPGKSTIESLVKPKGTYDELQSSLRRWDENDKRDDNSLLERIDHVSEVIDIVKTNNNGKYKQVEISTLLAIPTYEMSYYSKIIKSGLEDPERAIISDNELDDLRTVADICRLDDPEVRYEAFVIYQDKGNTSARSFVQRKIDELSESPKKTPAVPKPKKFTPSPSGVNKLVLVLKDALPELVEDLDESSDPATILEAILKRLDEEAK